jgi:hypothetical protein
LAFLLALLQLRTPIVFRLGFARLPVSLILTLSRSFGPTQESDMTKTQTTLAAALAGAMLLATTPILAGDNAMAEKFAADRLALFGKGDTAGLLAQYANDATVITPMGVLHGRDQIKGMIDGIIGEFAQPGVKFTLISQNAEDAVVAFTWSADTGKNIYELGVETYVLKDGMVEYQTFAAKVTPH